MRTVTLFVFSYFDVQVTKTFYNNIIWNNYFSCLALDIYYVYMTDTQLEGQHRDPIPRPGIQ